MTEETRRPQDLSLAARDRAGEHPAGAGFWPFVLYCLKVGTLGFGGPVALAGFMHCERVEQRRWIEEGERMLCSRFESCVTLSP